MFTKFWPVQRSQALISLKNWLWSSQKFRWAIQGHLHPLVLWMPCLEKRVLNVCLWIIEQGSYHINVEQWNPSCTTSSWARAYKAWVHTQLSLCSNFKVSLMLESVIQIEKFNLIGRNNEIFFKSKDSPEGLSNEIYPTSKFYAQLSWAWKNFHNHGTWSFDIQTIHL